MALAEVALRPDLTVPDFRKIKPKTVRSHATLYWCKSRFNEINTCVKTKQSITKVGSGYLDRKREVPSSALGTFLLKIWPVLH
jgi:hypothetical protein